MDHPTTENICAPIASDSALLQFGLVSCPKFNTSFLIAPDPPNNHILVQEFDCNEEKKKIVSCKEYVTGYCNRGITCKYKHTYEAEVDPRLHYKLDCLAGQMHTILNILEKSDKTHQSRSSRSSTRKLQYETITEPTTSRGRGQKGRGRGKRAPSRERSLEKLNKSGSIQRESLMSRMVLYN